MNDLPFGFSSSQGPDDNGDDTPGSGKGSGTPGSGGGFGGFGFAGGAGMPGMPGMPGQGGGPMDFGQLGQMLSQLGEMISKAGSNSGPVNYDVAKQVAVQSLAGSAAPSEQQRTAAADGVRLAELWLDEATTLPAGAQKTAVWSARDWVEHTIPTWQRLCDPVAQRIAGAWIDALPAEAQQMAGPLMTMVGQMGGMAFGSQLGNALGQLGAEVLTSTDVGLPLGPEATAALLPANIEKFTEGLERQSSEVLVFIAAREAAHQRLFAHVPWLRQRLLATVEEFAKGIKVDTSMLEQLAGQIDPANPASIEEAMSSGLLEPQTSEEQKTALRRLETMLALVEGWVDVVVAEAVADRLPGAEAMRETLRRRRASGGPAEQTFATLVGLELRPRKLRAASSLWRMVGDVHGMAARDGVWAHPDFIPTADDLDNPTDFVQRLNNDADDLDDPLAALRRTEEQEKAAAERASAGNDRDTTGQDTTGDTATGDNVPGSSGTGNSGTGKDADGPGSGDKDPGN